jgi:diguanylate cyclase (GGDEF)-like protein
VADRLRARTATLRVPTASAPVGLKVSIGVAEWRPATDTIEDLLRAADQALYAAKSGGRDCVVGHGLAVEDPGVLTGVR